MNFRRRMKIDAQLQRDDHVKAYRVHRRMTSLDWTIVFFSTLFLLQCLAQFWIRGAQGSVLWGIAGPACVVLSLIIDRRWLPKRLRQRPESDTPGEIEINADGIVIESSDGTVSQSWLRTAKYKTGKDLVLLYGYDSKYLIFPNRWFTPEQKEEFDGYLRTEKGEPAR